MDKNIPKHIAIIMDGNRRWARKRMLPTKAGHKAGAEALQKIIEDCLDIGVEHLTVYAFSTENWKRSEDEVAALMGLLKEYLNKIEKDIKGKDVRINVMGKISELDKDIYEKIVHLHETTHNNSKLTFNIALNYGGRDEIINVAKTIAVELHEGNIKLEDINEKLFNQYLYSSKSPDPDLIIRTAGEQRLSNFLLWQAAYSEFWYTDTYWPDFKKEDLLKAIEDFQKRTRKFGGA